MNRTILITAILSLVTPTLFAKEAVEPVEKQRVNPPASINISSRPEIMGLWGMVIPTDKKCVEYYNFKGGKALAINSGDEWSIGYYDYQPSPDNTQKTLPALALYIQYENNEADCSGRKEDQTGEIVQYFVRWQDRNTINFCSTETGEQCFVTLHRIRP